MRPGWLAAHPFDRPLVTPSIGLAGSAEVSIEQLFDVTLADRFAARADGGPPNAPDAGMISRV